jgi:hypothetical protein
MSRLVVSALTLIFANTIGIPVGAVDYKPSAPAASMLSRCYGSHISEPRLWLCDTMSSRTFGPPGPSDYCENVQPQAQQGFSYAPEPYVHSPEQTSLAYEQHGTTTVAACRCRRKKQRIALNRCVYCLCHHGFLTKDLSTLIRMRACRRSCHINNLSNTSNNNNNNNSSGGEALHV